MRAIDEIINDLEPLSANISKYVEERIDNETLDIEDATLFNYMIKFGELNLEISEVLLDQDYTIKEAELFNRYTNIKAEFDTTVMNVKAYFGV
jgi:hypothetical protein